MIEEGKINVRPASAVPRGSELLSGLPRRRLWRYGPLVVWAALIFIGSSDLLSGSHTSMFLVRPLHWLFPAAHMQTLQAIHFVIRKAGHFATYAVLALLAARAFKTSSHVWLRTQWFWAALLFVIVYSLSDEFHQSFVPTRGASIFDSLIDTLGGLTALALLAIRHRVRSPRVSKGW
jgi:VanZ family protein